ncbi:sphingolipid C4-monooxygenase [Ranunculus cassubicifolius]
MDISLSDEVLGAILPILVYWVYSGICMLLGCLDNYRLHSRRDENMKNLVSKGTVVKGVLLQQAVQAVVAILLYTFWLWWFFCLQFWFRCVKYRLLVKER